MKRCLVLLVACVLVATACTDTSDSPSPGASTSTSDGVANGGGRLRIIGRSDIDALDPAAMYSSLSWFIARGLYRTLTTYPDPGDGPAVVGDLATDAGTSNDDATEWTFTLKEGVRFGAGIGGRETPGVTGRQITCDDVKYGIERIFVPSVGAGYPFYYDILSGAEEFADGTADDIAGIECPDERTILFHLTEPAADWPYRLSMPATSPVPRSLGQRFDDGATSDYAEHVVFTGPYLIDEREPGRMMRLERNAEWDPATDPARAARFEGVDWTMGGEAKSGVRKTLRNEYDLALDLPARGPQLERIVADPQLLPRLVNESEGCTRYIFLNTRIRPFDDPLVRKAVALAIDRSNLKRIFGGPATGPLATSVIPPGIEGHLAPDTYSPFASEALAGDIPRARRLMKRAGYPNGYDRPVRVVGAAGPPLDVIFDSVVGDLRRLGFTRLVTLQPPVADEYDKYYARPSSKTAVGTSAGWCKDYPKPYSFVAPVLTRSAISTGTSRNYANLFDPELEDAMDAAVAETEPAAATPLWEEVNRIATETAAWVPWSWDESAIVLGRDLQDARYLPFFGQIDWVNARVKRARSS